MNEMNKNMFTAAVAGATLLASGAASAIVVGGVDFGILGEDPINTHLETTTLAESFVDDDGQEIFGYGQVNTVNGNSNYAGGDLLYFVFEDYTTQNFVPGVGGSTGFTGGIIEVFLGSAGNLSLDTSPNNIAAIEALTPWLTLTGRADALGNTLFANGNVTGASLSFTGSGLLDVAGGLADVVSYLDVNDIADGVGGFADIILTTSANNAVLNPFDVAAGLADGCQDGSAVPGAWCLGGSADLRGSTRVPEPGIFALLGIGLVGFGFSARKNKTA